MCQKRPIYIKRDLQKRPRCAFLTRKRRYANRRVLFPELRQMCQKRPIYIKRNLQKRRICALPTRKHRYVSMRAYSSLSYDTRVKETFKRDLYTSKETYIHQKRRICPILTRKRCYAYRRVASIRVAAFKRDLYTSKET